MLETPSLLNTGFTPVSVRIEDRDICYCAVSPPSMTSSLPVTNLDSGEGK